MAKARDKLFLEEGIGEADIDESIKQLELEKNTEFQRLMRENEDAFQ